MRDEPNEVIKPSGRTRRSGSDVTVTGAGFGTGEHSPCPPKVSSYDRWTPIPAEEWTRPATLDACAKQDIGALLRLARKYGNSQVAIATRIPTMGQNGVSRIQNGHRSVEALRLIADVADALEMPDPARIALGIAPTHYDNHPHRTSISERDSPHQTGEPMNAKPEHDASESGKVPTAARNPTVLKVVLEERHLRTPKAFRAQFLRAARDLADRESDIEFRKLDVSERQFKRWLAGARPREYSCRVLEHMLDRPIGELLGSSALSPVSPDCSTLSEYDSPHPASETPAASLPRYSAPVSTLLDTVYDMVEADVYRREVLVNLPFLLSALHEPTRNWLLTALSHPTASNGGTRVSKANLDQIRTMLNMFAEGDAQLGGGHGRQALAEYLRTTVLPLLRAETDEATRRALFDLAGEQAQLLGWMSYDTGEYGVAERYLLQALRLSEEARNPILGAHTLATLSHLATTLGHSDEGVQLARTGQTALRGASNAMSADLAVLEARSLAIGGDARSAATAIHRAEKALRDVVTDDEPPEMRFIDHAYVAGEIANTLVLLGDAPRAIDFAHQSIDSSVAQKRARRGALSSVALAQAHLAQRDIDGASAAGTQALRLAQGVDSARTTQALRSLKTGLKPYIATGPVLTLIEEMDAAAI